MAVTVLNASSHHFEQGNQFGSNPLLTETEAKTSNLFAKMPKAEPEEELQPLTFEAVQLTENFTLLLALIILKINEIKQEERHLEFDHLALTEEVFQEYMIKQKENQDSNKDYLFNMASALIQIGTAPVSILQSPALFNSVQSKLTKVPVAPIKSAIDSFMKAGPKAVSDTLQGVSSGTSQVSGVIGNQASTKKQFNNGNIQLFIEILRQRQNENKGAKSEEKQDIEKMIQLLKAAYDALAQAQARV